MLDTLKKKIEKLISLYETEKAIRMEFEKEVQQLKAENEAYRKQNIELEKQIDNLKLTGAILTNTRDNSEAKKKIDSLLKEIDKCIALVKGR